jgi:hypothetical protein
MPEDLKAPPKPATKAAPPQPVPVKSEADLEQEKEIGDFITRHVLDKDSVFFEG